MINYWSLASLGKETCSNGVQADTIALLLLTPAAGMCTSIISPFDDLAFLGHCSRPHLGLLLPSNEGN